MIGTWYEIEEKIPAENAIGGQAYWHSLANAPGFDTYRGTEDDAIGWFNKLSGEGREVRIVRVQRQVTRGELRAERPAYSVRSK